MNVPPDRDTMPASLEAAVGRRARAALEASCNELPADILFRLQQSRERALEVATPRRQPAWLPRLAGLPAGLGGRLLRDHLLPAGAILLLAFLASMAGQQSQDERLNEAVDIDTALLTDDLPIDAYLDRGFGAWLASRSDR